MESGRTETKNRKIRKIPIQNGKVEAGAHLVDTPQVHITRSFVLINFCFELNSRRRSNVYLHNSVFGMRNRKLFQCHFPMEVTNRPLLNSHSTNRALFSVHKNQFDVKRALNAFFFCFERVRLA